jgi:hypothetical protein
LAGFFAQVGCRVTSESEGAVPVLNYYRITVTGCNQSSCSGAIGPTYVERQLVLTLAK